MALRWKKVGARSGRVDSYTFKDLRTQSSEFPLLPRYHNQTVVMGLSSAAECSGTTHAPETHSSLGKEAHKLDIDNVHTR